MIPIWPLLHSRLAGYVIGAVLVATLTGVGLVKISSLKYQLAQSELKRAETVAEYHRAASESAQAARRALEAAVEAERENARGRLAQERQAADRLREAAREAREQAAQWQERLRAAEATDPSCAAWIREKVRCPVR